MRYSAVTSPLENPMKALLMLLPLALAACSAAPDPVAPATTPNDTASTAPVVSSDTLARYHWQLRDAVDGNNRRLDGLFRDAGDDRPLQLDFTADRVNASQACNAIGAGYRLVEDHLDTEMMMHTMMACPDPVLMERESTISKLLQDKPTVILTGTDDAPILALSAPSGQTLTFAGIPTAETRYGGPGETVFLEVADDEIPCNHPLIPGKTCLQVRERHYDEQGLASGEPGPWQPLQQDIEGYTHEAGVRNVLRLKRYTIKNPPADAPDTAYVLDMVVESEAPKTDAPQ